MRAGLLIAVLTFLFFGSDVLLDQWITGYASATYILGTAALIAGICMGLFAVIAALGLAIAAAFRSKAIMGSFRGSALTDDGVPPPSAAAPTDALP